MNEYVIDENGITLNGVTWQDADHLNVRTEAGTTNFHAEAKCAAVPAPPECSPIMQTAAQKIGQNFISWGDLGIGPDSCIQWVQFSRANYHYGEQGEAPLCLTTPPVIPPVEPPAPLGYIPESAKDCDGVVWSHPETTTKQGAPSTYKVSVNGGDKVDYTPGTQITVEWPGDGSTPVISLFGYYDSGFWHQLGQTKFVNDLTCTVEPEPEVPPTTVIPEPPVIDVPTSIEVPTSTPAPIDELAVTGGTDFFPLIIAAAALLTAGGFLLRKAFAR